MNKDQFWKVIDTANAFACGLDETSRIGRMSEALIKYSLEDIADWHLIMLEYIDAAFRRELWAACAAMGGQCTADGFIDFRMWIISCGKEVYMNALDEPDTLAEAHWDDKFNYRAFVAIPDYAYDAKLFRIDPDSYKTLDEELTGRKLNEQTVKDIRSEFPQRDDLREDWRYWMLPKLFPEICKVHEPKDIDGLMKRAGHLAIGYVYQSGECKKFIFHETPSNLAHFVGSRPRASKIIVTDELDQLILNTMGNFIDRCSDQELLEEIKKDLIPIQLGETQAKPFFCPAYEEVQKHFMKKPSLQMGGM